MTICSTDDSIQELFLAASIIQENLSKIILDTLTPSKAFHITEVFDMETSNASISLVDGVRGKGFWDCDITNYGEITVDLFTKNNEVVIWLLINTKGDIFLASNSNKVPDLFKNLDYYCKTYTDLIKYVDNFIQA